MTKSLALEAKQAIIKSQPSPTVRARQEYFDFDDYNLARQMMDAAMWKCRSRSVINKRPYLDELEKWYRVFDAGRKIYERDELYRTRKVPRQNMLGEWTDRQISRRVVSEKISLLVGSIPKGMPRSKKTAQAFVGMMIEEVIAANPSASVLEAAFRALRRRENIVPSTAQVLKELSKQAEEWDDGWLDFDETDLEDWLKHRDREIEEAAKEAEQKRREQERREQLERERPEREARERREREERNAKFQCEQQERERQKREHEERERRAERELVRELAEILVKGNSGDVASWEQRIHAEFGQRTAG
jgi:hypothetical protein